MYGLILPAKVENGTPIYTWESDPEDEEDMDKALVLSKEMRQPAKPSAQLERPRTPSNILHKVKSFANFIATSDAEKDVPELPTLNELLDQFGLPPGTPSDTAPRSFLRTTRSSSSLRPKTPTRPVPSATKLRSKRSAGISRSQISNPIAPEEMRRVGSDFSQAVARRGRNASGGERDSLYASSLRSPSNLISPSLSTSVPLYLLQPQHPTIYFGQNEAPPEFRHAPPRLAPMEYTRQYYIAKAKAEREGVDCTILKPGTVWAWTEHFKEFLLLPQLPAGLQRNFLPDNGEHCKFSKMGTPGSLDTDYAKASSKYARHVATETSAPEASSRISSMRAQDSLPPSRSSVARNQSSSPRIPSSVTSADTAAYYRQKRLPKRPEPAQKDPVTEAIESSRNSELPSLHVRRRRAVPSLPQISASQAYPKPLRLSTMKSPSPAPTASTADRAASAASTGTVARSTSRLITDIGNELNREMEEVLSPRSAAMAHRALTPKKEVDIDTPTRRPRQVQSMKSIPFNAPPLPAPNKPLPSIPKPQTPKPKPKTEAPDSGFIDVDFGPGPARSYVPARPPPPIPVLKPIDTTSPSAFDTTFDPYVTRADFSIKRDRTVRPAASMATMSPRPTPLVDQRQQRVVQPTTSAYAQRPANAPSRFLGKMASMAELKNGRRDTISSRSTDSDDAVGMRTFLSEDSAASSASSSTRDKATSGSKRKFLSNLFKRNRKDGEN
ncbi:uncharacterized protein N0V96_010901 [Colletotrichum fioriniae]|uniref:uncharacterized protein n=1 Tax=Colletotrichum fioriniae TaxID=710243 RepID=UPI0032DA976E|nr:hypothetical protein N0V96_010901 [Colletotrichum fioriniae]